jgi:hypothetical protein
MTSALYAASVPVLERYLERLAGLVAHADDVALAARLAPDMLPFAQQAEIAANFALRIAFPLAGRAVPPYGEFPATQAGLQARIARVRTLLADLRPGDFVAPEAPLSDRAGEAGVTLPAQAFLSEYALPNFFFHLTSAYAILRSRGIALGKRDFDGLHAYTREPA